MSEVKSQKNISGAKEIAFDYVTVEMEERCEIMMDAYNAFFEENSKELMELSSIERLAILSEVGDKKGLDMGFFNSEDEMVKKITAYWEDNKEMLDSLSPVERYRKVVNYRMSIEKTEII